jgi:hypothetical protein
MEEMQIQMPYAKKNQKWLRFAASLQVSMRLWTTTILEKHWIFFRIFTRERSSKGLLFTLLFFFFFLLLLFFFLLLG